jgi:hypothetical protein
MEQRALKGRAVALLLTLVLAGALLGAWYLRSTQIRFSSSEGHITRAQSSWHAPANVRVRVEVLNATRVSGLARRATMHLRDLGFDVVETGTAAERREDTLVIDRSNHPDWTRAIAGAMGGAATASRPDSSRYVDVTVLVGASWRPPAKPFYP